MAGDIVHALVQKSGPAPAKGTTPNRYIARCGAESIESGGYTAWESEVTCESCLTLTKMRHDAIVHDGQRPRQAR